MKKIIIVFSALMISFGKIYGEDFWANFSMEAKKNNVENKKSPADIKTKKNGRCARSRRLR
jgi:hypothetical protein